MVSRKPSRFGWLERANIITMAAVVRRDHPEYPVVTANDLADLSDEEIHRIWDQLNTLLRSLGQVE